MGFRSRSFFSSGGFADGTDEAANRGGLIFGSVQIFRSFGLAERDADGSGRDQPSPDVHLILRRTPSQHRPSSAWSSRGSVVRWFQI